MNLKLRPMTSNQLKADLFLQLGQMESAGLELGHVLAILKQDAKKSAPNFREFEKQLKRGQTLSQAGFKARLFSELDCAVIHAGETSGGLSRVYQQLASHYAALALHRRQLLSKLLFPFFVLVLFIFLQPLPSVIAGAITGQDYVVLTFGTLVKLLVLAYIALNIGSWLTNGFLKNTGLDTMVFRLQLVIPVYAAWLKARQINIFFKQLGLLLSAGIAVSEALPIATKTMTNPLLRKKFQPVIASVTNGNSLFESLRTIREIPHQHLQQVHTAEQSGRLEQSILHFTDIESKKLSAQNAFIVVWIPRLIYFLIAAMIAYSLITTSVISSVPTSL